MAFCRGAVGHMLSLLRRAQEGVVAVEFALASGPLLAVLLFIVDMAANQMIFRQIDLVGQSLIVKFRSQEIMPEDYSAQTFREQLVCPELPVLVCEKIVVNLGPPEPGSMISSTDVSAARWCSGIPDGALILQLAYPVPFVSRIWAGNFADRSVYYVVSFALRNAPCLLRQMR